MVPVGLCPQVRGKSLTYRQWLLFWSGRGLSPRLL